MSETDKARQHAREAGLSPDSALFFQTVPTEIVVALANGTIDAQCMAQDELASRGLSATGAWVGFDA